MNAPKRPRTLRALPPVSVAAVAVSQLTCLALLGMDARRYLEFVRAHPTLLRTRVGKLVLVGLDDARALLRRLAVAGVGDELGELRAIAGDALEQPETADEESRGLLVTKRDAGVAKRDVGVTRGHATTRVVTPSCAEPIQTRESARARTLSRGSAIAMDRQTPMPDACRAMSDATWRHELRSSR